MSTNEDKLKQEKNELNTLINRGVTFEVEDVEIHIHKKFFGLIKKRIPVPVVRKFRVEEPTLGTLDRLSAEWVEFAISEDSLKSKDGMKHARTLANEHARRCAKVIAIAVLGSDYLVPKVSKHGVQYTEDVNKLNELTSLFCRTIKPSQLYQLYVLINAMSNLADFTNSIRLMLTERTTMPVLIEESNGV